MGPGGPLLVEGTSNLETGRFPAADEDCLMLDDNRGPSDTFWRLDALSVCLSCSFV